MRSTENKLSQIPFIRGMDESVDEFAADPGAMKSVLDARIHQGRLQTRPGWSTLGDTAPVSSFFPIYTANKHPTFAGKVGSQIVVGTSSGMAGDLLPDQTKSSTTLGTVPTAKPLRIQASAEPLLQGLMPGVATNSQGFVCTATPVSNPAFGGFVVSITIYDPDGNITYQDSSNRQSTAGLATVVRVITVGTNFGIVYQSSSTTISVSLIDAYGAGVGTTPVSTLAGGNASWDTCSYDATNWLIIFYDGSSLTLVKMLNGGVVASTTIIVAGNSPCSIVTIGTSIWAGWYDRTAATPTIKYQLFDISLTGGTVFTVMSTPPANTVWGAPLINQLKDAATTSALIAIRNVRTSAPFTAGTIFGTITSAGVVTISKTLINWGYVPVSKPDTSNRLWVLPYFNTANLSFGQTALVQLDGVIGLGSDLPLMKVCLAAPLQDKLILDLAAGTMAYQFFSAISEGPTSVFAFPSVLSPIEGNTTYVGTSTQFLQSFVYQYETVEQEPVLSVLEANQFLLTAGTVTQANFFPGINSSFSGNGSSEIGFLEIPTIYTLTSGSGGAMTASGSYSYIVIWERIDTFGNRHLSAPSNPVSVVLGTADSAVTVLFTRPFCIHTFFYQTINALIYRTVNGGTTYHLAARIPPAVAIPADGTFTYVDLASDASVSDNEDSYIDGGTLDNDLAPSGRFLTKSEERVWVGGLWHEDRIQCSKIYVPGEPYNFPDDPTHQVVLTAPCTGLAYMDGTVVAFTESSINLVTGFGPDDTGNGGFDSPRILAKDIGCINYRSIVETSVGIFFQARNGIYLIPRGFGSPQLVSDPVSETLIALPDVLGSAVFESSLYFLVRFLVAVSGDPSTTVALTYDLDSQQWIKDTLVAASNIIGSGPEGFLVMPYTLSANAVAYYERLDDNLTNVIPAAYSSPDVTSTWINSFGQGAHGFYHSLILSFRTLSTGSFLTETITIEATIDDKPVKTKSWTVTCGPGIFYRGMTLPNQAGTALKVRVYCTTSGTGLGVRLLNLTLETSSDGGIRPLSDSERA